jgi:ELWxxDGT repeat protein
MVANINPSQMVAVGSTVYFVAADAAHGEQLWKSDGTPGGTTMVTDVNPTTGGLRPSALTNVNGKVFFEATDGVHHEGLWRSDGTAAGTVQLTSGFAWTPFLTDVNGTLFFATVGLNGGDGLWKSDGTVAGTVLIKDYLSLSDGTDFNGTLFFEADDATHRSELWKSDGTVAGTTIVNDTVFAPSNLTDVSGTLFFAAYNSGFGIWKSDGTAAGTVKVSSIAETPQQLTNVNGTLFFTTFDANGEELWTSDGTAAGTVMVRDFVPGGIRSTGYYGLRYDANSTIPANVNGTLFFATNDGTHGTELWKSDGTAAGTAIVKDIFPGEYFSQTYYQYVPNSSNPANLTNVNGTLFFTANDGVNGIQLWQSDGTAAGTTMVNLGSASPYPTDLTNANGTLFLAAHNQLWALNTVPSPSLAVSGFPASTTAGIAGSFTVTAENADGTTNTGYTGTVQFNTTDRQATIVDPATGKSVALQGFTYTFTAADGGVHTFSSTLKTAGTQFITAADTTTVGMGGTDGNITVNAAAASTMTVSGFPSATAGGAANFTVTVQDQYGNTASGYTGTVQLKSTDSQAVLPASYAFTSADAGVHTFSVTFKTAGTQSITASDTTTVGLTGTDGNITVNAAAASRMTVAGFPSTTSAGAAGSFTVTLKDRFGNIASGYTGTVHFSSSDAKALLPANYTFTAGDAGKHTFSAALKTAGTQSITVADTFTTALTATEGGITVNAAAASKFIITAPSTVTAGAPFSLTLTVEDAYGNVVTGYAGTVRFTSSDRTATLPAMYTFLAQDKDVHTFTGLVLRKTGKQKITITDTLHSALTASVIENVQ